jgi:uncharacterized protein DUF955
MLNSPLALRRRLSRCFGQRTISSKVNPEMPRPPLKRGFKTEAEEYSLEFRTELGLSHDSPLCPRRLAQHLAIPVYPLSALRQDIPEAVGLLLGSERRVFSAITVFKGSGRIIVYNDAHSSSRQVSDIAHELAHGVLGHPPCPPLSDEGCRNFDPRLEAEAEWLGPTLLVPKPAALRIAWQRLTIAQAAIEFGVSEALIQMRLNLTGALKIVKRTLGRRSSSRRYLLSGDGF